MSRQALPGASLLSALLLVCSTILPHAAAAEPYEPEDDALVLERQSMTGTAADADLRDLRTRLADRPDDLNLALKLARQAIVLGRSRGDPRYYGRAEGALRPWWSEPRPPAEVAVLRAVVRQASHDFEAALLDLDAVVAADPSQAQAQVSRAFVLMVLGRHEEAREGCENLPAERMSLVRAVCLARVESLTGAADRAAGRLREALSADGADPRLRHWAYTVLGGITAQRGDAAAAEAAFRTALAIDRGDVGLLAAYADLLLDAGRPQEALDLLRPAPRTDGLLLRQAIARKHLEDSGHAALASELAARFAASRRRGDGLHLREEAAFALWIEEAAVRALDLALKNWRLQKEPADARLVLASALEAGRPTAARDVITWVEETGLEDVVVDRLMERLSAGES